MKTIDPDLQSDLDAGSTTLCRCWRLTRGDGTQLGFTDGDEDLVFDGLTYRASTGFTASTVESSLGLNIDGIDVEGALVADVLSEDDLAAGLWDNAGILVSLVDWRHPSRRVVLFAGSVGEISRGRSAFVAELRSQSHALNQPRGRLYQRFCDADLGDARCGVDIDVGSWRDTGLVASATSPKQFTATGLGDRPDGHFSLGQILWTGGRNDGMRIEVKHHGRTGAAAVFLLAEDLPFLPAAGDAFTVWAGCDKTFATCRDRFGNAHNFRGFPHMPGNDWLVSPPSRKDRNDGGRRP